MKPKPVPVFSGKAAEKVREIVETPLTKEQNKEIEKCLASFDLFISNKLKTV